MRTVRLALLTAALVVLPAATAGAHPALDPNAVPIGEAVDATLVVPHGCSTGAGVRPEDGESVATTRFDLQLVDGVTVEPAEVDGWDVTDDGEAIVWTDAGGATTDPIELPVTLTVEDGTPGETIELAAFQECEGGSSYRWTPGSEDTPPVRLELTEGETGTVEHDMGEGHHGAASEGTMDDASETATDAPASPTATETGAATDGPTAEAAAVEGDDGGSNGGAIASVVAVLVVLLGAGVFARRRGDA